MFDNLNRYYTAFNKYYFTKLNFLSMLNETQCSNGNVFVNVTRSLINEQLSCNLLEIFKRLVRSYKKISFTAL